MPSVLKCRDHSNIHIPLQGALSVPGDKSISHRAIILGALSGRETHIFGLNKGEDVLATLHALKACGLSASIYDDALIIQAPYVWHPPKTPLDLGNSGTSARLLCGMFARLPICVVLKGDASLHQRPMGRVVEPLRHIGANIEYLEREGFLPLQITGTNKLNNVDYILPVASAQVKSALLLAGLGLNKQTQLIDPFNTRDHTERMLEFLGADITYKDGMIRQNGSLPQTNDLLKLSIPGDPSSAAFLMVAALLCKNSHITLKNILNNPTRTAFMDVLIRMGGNIETSNIRTQCGESLMDLSVQFSDLKGVMIEASQAPHLIDEYPILSIAAAFANGISVFKGLGELRFKESDRLQSIHHILKSLGVHHVWEGDQFEIHGQGLFLKDNLSIQTSHDHRIAMSALVSGKICNAHTSLDDAMCIETSFPGFAQLLDITGSI